MELISSKSLILKVNFGLNLFIILVKYKLNKMMKSSNCFCRKDKYFLLSKPYFSLSLTLKKSGQIFPLGAKTFVLSFKLKIPNLTSK